MTQWFQSFHLLLYADDTVILKLHLLLYADDTVI